MNCKLSLKTFLLSVFFRYDLMWDNNGRTEESHFSFRRNVFSGSVKVTASLFCVHHIAATISALFWFCYSACWLHWAASGIISTLQWLLFLYISFSFFLHKTMALYPVICYRVMLKVMRIHSHLFFLGLKNVRNNSNKFRLSMFVFTNKHIHINQVTKIMHRLDFKIEFFLC